jgi:hypothetical protein
MISYQLKKTRESGFSYDCPNEVDQKQLDELHLAIVKKEE